MAKRGKVEWLFQPLVGSNSKTLNKEKLSGAKRILAEHKTLLYLILYMKNVILPENVIQKVENIQLKRK